MRKIFLVAIASFVMFGISRMPVNAIAVNSLDCSGIDTTDGNVEDWTNISDLIATDESVDGTTYYLQEDGTWTDSEPDEWQYSANLDQQANIQQMKVCNTDTFFMMLRTEEPMMFFYDKENDTYVDFWSWQDFDGDGRQDAGFTLPADYHYWMVWKMQDVEGTGSILYFAADLTMDEGRELSNFDAEATDRVPQLYLYRESEEGIAYDDAVFDPFEDTELTTIEISEDESGCDPNDESDDAACSQDKTDKSSYAFEVSQDISELFKYSDFSYGDTINMSAAMYNSDEFNAASGRAVLQLVDATETEEYTFSQQAVRKLSLDSNSVTSASAKLAWKKMKNATSYQMKLINPNNDKTIRVIKNIKKIQHTTRSLQTNTTYRAVVRAVLPKKNGKKQFSAWSSGVKWTTE